VLVLSTERGHTARRVGSRARTTSFRRAFRNRRRVARGIYRSGRWLAHVKARRVTWIGVASTTSRTRLRTAARAAGL
jgi:hypothetical protein